MPRPALNPHLLLVLTAGVALGTVGLAWWFQPGFGGLVSCAGGCLALAWAWWRLCGRWAGWRQHVARGAGLAVALGGLAAVGLVEVMALSEWFEDPWADKPGFPLSLNQAWPGVLGCGIAAALASWLLARRRGEADQRTPRRWPARTAVIVALAALGVFANWYAAGWFNVLEVAEQGRVATLDYLLRSRPGAARARGFGDWTALHWATRAGQPAAVAALLRGGADIEGLVRGGQRPLHLAAENGCPSVIQLLLAGGASVAARDVDGLTPLHAAAHQRRFEAVQLLLAAGADAKARARDGLTPLHLAAARGSGEIEAALLAAGADARSRTHSRQTPLHFAALSDAPDAARTLVAAGADVNAQTVAGSTPLHIAALSGCPELAKVLLAAGATVNPQDASRDTPLDYAEARNDFADPERKRLCVVLLLASGGKTGAELDKAGL